MPNIYNQDFLRRVKTAASIDAVNANTGAWIRDRVRELSFLKYIQPPEPIDPAACQPSVFHNGLSKIIEMEPESQAKIIGWMSQSDSQYVQAKKAEMFFTIISSDVFEVHQENLLAWQQPITNVLENNTVRDIQERTDALYLNLAYQSTAQTRKVATYAGPFDKVAAKTAFDFIDGDRLSSAALLISPLTFNQISTQGNEFWGADLASDVSVNAFRYDKLMGRKLVVTNKADFLTRNPYKPDDATVISFVNSGSLTVPLDPAFKVGTNLRGLHVGNIAANPTYASTANLVNAYFVSTYTDANGGSTGALYTADGAVFVAGGTYDASSVSTSTNTGTWLGNTSLAFTAPEFLGKHYLLQDVNMSIEQHSRLISWEAWINMAIGIQNVRSVSQVTTKIN
jgi:hypothetical protein